MMKRPIILITILLLFASACGEEEPLSETPKDYFPLGKGSSWVLAVEEQDAGKIKTADVELRSTWTEVVRGVEYLKVQVVKVSGDELSDDLENRWFLLRVDENGVTGFTADEEEEREYVFLKEPFEVGTKWQVVADDEVEVIGEYLSSEETVIMPAGEFNDCLKVRYTVRDIDDKTLKDEYAIFWLAPDVGLVKSESKEEGDTLRSKLISYSIKHLEKITAKLINTSPAEGGTLELPGKLTIEFDQIPKSVWVNGDKADVFGTTAIWSAWGLKSGLSDIKIEWEDDEGRKQSIIKMSVVRLNKTPIELLPRDNDISGWMRVGIPIKATNYSELYDVIDGAAKRYIDNGFVSAAFQDYKNAAGLSLMLAIYEHASEASVDALYEDLTPAATQPLIIAGIKKGRIDESALMAYTIEFQKGKYFVQIVINEKSDDALGIAKIFASHVANEIP